MYLFVVVLLVSCEGQYYKVTNLSGVDWYKTDIWYKSHKEAGTGLDGSQSVGTVLIGNSATFYTKSGYFFIDADDKNGNSIMSKTLPLSGNEIVIRASDLY